MTEKTFRATRLILGSAPSVYLSVCSLFLLYYIVTEPFRGWRFVGVAVFCMIMAYWGQRTRYNLVDRRRKSLSAPRLFVALHALTVVLLPLVRRSLQEMGSETERQAFYRDTYREGYVDYPNDRRAQILNQIRILALVAFFGLVLVAGIQAAHEYVTFETISASSRN